MYTWEMIDFINQRGRYIGGDDLLKIISQEENPQIKLIRYKAGETEEEPGIYYIEAKNDSGEGIEKLWFETMPYKEAEAKGLVKNK